VFFICVYWIFFGCTLLRLLLFLFDIFYYGSKWTYIKTIHATIASALLARAIHLTLLRSVNEGDNLFKSALDEDLLFKILSSIPGYILISAYTLLALLWLSLLGKTYDLSTVIITKRISLFGKTYDASTTNILKYHLRAFFFSFNFFLYCSWIIFFFLMWKIQQHHELIYKIEAFFTAIVGLLLAILFGGMGSQVYFHFQHNPILSVERLRLSKRVLGLILLCSAVFVIKLPFTLCGLFAYTSSLTSFMFDVFTYSFLEILPFLIFSLVATGKKWEERNDESAHFSFGFRKYSLLQQ